jgi:hypothetical protein
VKDWLYLFLLLLALWVGLRVLDCEQGWSCADEDCPAPSTPIWLKDEQACGCMVRP